jgi:outer membrane protein assembly factor BamB
MWQLALLATLAAPVDLETVWTREIDAGTMEVAGDNLLLWTRNAGYAVLDAVSGNTLGTFDNVARARLSDGKVLTMAGTIREPSAIEAWSISPLKRLWSMLVTGHVGLGEIVGNYLFYGTHSAINKVSLPDFKLVDTREVTRSYGASHPRVVNGRVYFQRLHEVYGLDANSLKEGWRNYCDAWPQFVDDIGFVGTGAVYFPLAIVKWDGKTVPYERTIEGDYTFYRREPAVTEDVVVATGNVSVGTPDPDDYLLRILGPYLFAFDRHTGNELWRLAMAASNTVVVDGKLFHVGGNKVNGKLIQTFQLRDLRTGRLLWKSNQVEIRYEDEIISNGRLLFERTNGRLRAMRFMKWPAMDN